TLTGFENQDYPYEDLVEQVVVNRDVSRNPLFDTMFVLQNVETVKIAIPGLKLSPYNHRYETSKFDLTLIGQQAEDKLLFTFEYSTKLFRESTIERFIRYFKKIISSVLYEGKKNTGISEIDILPGEEKRQLLFDFNRTEAAYPKDKTLHRLFEEQLEKTPDRIAAATGLLQLSYRKLNEKSNRLANALIQKGAGPHTIVGIMVERSIEMIIGILGILKTGAAYLPLDISNPRERTRYILTDSGVKILLTRKDFEEEMDSYSIKNPENDANSGDLLYVIYT
ncbi:MAG: AMP-binding protein, partial [bacterium]|nr:AMP-binding protein [bacterium]